MAGRPKLADGLKRMDLRVRPDALSWLHSQATSGGVNVSEFTRTVLSRGKACMEGRCGGDGDLQRRYEARGKRNTELVEQVAALQELLRTEQAPPPVEEIDWRELTPIANGEDPF